MIKLGEYLTKKEEDDQDQKFRIGFILCFTILLIAGWCLWN